MKRSPTLWLCLKIVAAAACLATTDLRAQTKLTLGKLAALEAIPASEAPGSGNYMLAKGRNPNIALPPFPCLPEPLRQLNVPVYPLGSNWFLIDDSSVDYASIDAVNSFKQALTLQKMDFDGQEDDSGGPFLRYPDGSLWLGVALTNYPLYGNMAALTLNGTTNGAWYEILSKRSVQDPGWWSEGSLQGFTNQSVSQTMVSAESLSGDLFFRAHALTNGSGSTLPIWWQLQNFGRTGLDPSFSPGADGISLLQSYWYGMEPNAIEFALTATNNYSRTNSMSLQVQVEKGLPFYKSVLVDSIDFAGATWSPYTSTNLAVNLGSLEGWHDVLVGIRGFSTNSHATWKHKRLKLDHSPPQLSLISPAQGTVRQPRIQLVGKCPEALGAIRYDLSNSFGLLLNQQVLLLNQHYDTNTWELTTNMFQAFDVNLAQGANLVTLHAADLAGNHATTNFIFRLDYSDVTNAPSVEVAWPQNGTKIAASTFTLRGWTDDPTSTVRVRTAGTNGVFRTYCGIVERTGKFWVDSVPLAAGTNVMTLSVGNAAARSDVRTITVVRSDVLVTMNPITPAAQLWQAAVNVSGMVSDPAYAVWINGVKATSPGNGTWTAVNVPVTGGNVAIFQMTAYAPGEEQPDGSHGN